MADNAANSHSASVDPDEVAKFAALAGEWWDPAGTFAPLHRLNPARLTFIRDRIAAHNGRDPLAERPLAGLRVLDIGCGGGLLCEPMARLGAAVTGIDAAERNVAVAADHAAEAGLDIDYRHSTAEALAAKTGAGNGAGFDLVLNMPRSTARRNPSPSPSSAPSTFCAGCRAAPTTGAASCAPRRWWRTCARPASRPGS